MVTKIVVRDGMIPEKKKRINLTKAKSPQEGNISTDICGTKVQHCGNNSKFLRDTVPYQTWSVIGEGNNRW